jgi:hypothetical protein
MKLSILHSLAISVLGAFSLMHVSTYLGQLSHCLASVMEDGVPLDSRLTCTPTARLVLAEVMVSANDLSLHPQAWRIT